MKLKDFINEGRVLDIDEEITVKAQLIDGPKIISEPFDIEVKMELDHIANQTAAPDADDREISEYSITTTGKQVINSIAKKFDVLVSDDSIQDALDSVLPDTSFDINSDIIEIEID